MIFFIFLVFLPSVLLQGDPNDIFNGESEQPTIRRQETEPNHQNDPNHILFHIYEHVDPQDFQYQIPGPLDDQNQQNPNYIPYPDSPNPQEPLDPHNTQYTDENQEIPNYVPYPNPQDPYPAPQAPYPIPQTPYEENQEIPNYVPYPDPPDPQNPQYSVDSDEENREIPNYIPYPNHPDPQNTPYDVDSDEEGQENQEVPYPNPNNPYEEDQEDPYPDPPNTQYSVDSEENQENQEIPNYVPYPNLPDPQNTPYDVDSEEEDRENQEVPYPNPENPYEEDQEDPYQDPPNTQYSVDSEENQENQEIPNYIPYPNHPDPQNTPYDVDSEEEDRENQEVPYPNPQNPYEEDQEIQDLECLGGSCNPQLGDLMLGRETQLSASSTCGLRHPQEYCIVGYLEEDQKCFLCDSHTNSHRIQNVITSFNTERTWWQSENGVHDVSIRLDLETLFQFSHLVLTFKSFRPAAMLVERSADFGKTWKVFRYFAADCSEAFPDVPSGPARNVEDVICDGRYSGSEPSTEGEVVLKALDPVFHIENPYAAHIQDLVTLTNIRVNFTRLFTLGDTFTRKRRNPEDKYYYAVYNMMVRGSCFCHGHAAKCVPVDTQRGDVFTQSNANMVHGRCVCHHNTAGENCEKCRDFHNDSPWRPAGGTADDICRKCECNGRSESCHFDAARYQSTNQRTGGVCDGCRDNRMGPNCETCQPFTFQDPHRDACIPCDCDPAGSHGNGLCDAVTGDCLCKENVEGKRCDRCKQGHFNLRPEDPNGCQACRCHPLGTAASCDQLTGRCRCERLAVGPFCDTCLTGFWGLGDSGSKCLPCDCDIGGASGHTCSQDKGQCVCLPHLIGRRCSDPAPGYFLPAVDYFLYEAELAAPLYNGGDFSSPVHNGESYPTVYNNNNNEPESSTDDGNNAEVYPEPDFYPTAVTQPPSSSLTNPGLLPECERYFREQGFEVVFRDGRLVLVGRNKRRRRRQGQISYVPGAPLQIIPRQPLAGQPVSWTGLGLVRVQTGAGLSFTVDNLPLSTQYHMVLRYEPEAPCDWTATVSIITLSPGDGQCNDIPGSMTLGLPGNARGAILASPVCLNAGGRYAIHVVFNKSPSSDFTHILIDSMGLSPIIEPVFSDNCSDRESMGKSFRCFGSMEPSMEHCVEMGESMSARLHNGAVACGCNSMGSNGASCSKEGGACDCKPNVIGRCCDSCSPLTFGFGPEGCKPCECDPRGSTSQLCDTATGACFCRPGVEGRVCDRCSGAFWDFPNCRRCECNNLSEHCHPQTGECLDCREHSTGPHCDRCIEGYLPDPVSCSPCLCPDLLGSGRYFASSCSHNPQSSTLTCDCMEGHIGARCDRCGPGYYGDLAVPGSSCQLCPCNDNVATGDQQSCDPVTGRCLHCLFNTAGENCELCRPGYYGNALTQDCKECSCDRRGSQVTSCALSAPCLCEQTGQCFCRPGVTGLNCDECLDEHWNLNAPSGCLPCDCDPANSISNLCDKVTGQCPCRPEFGGRTCDECGDNHFGNPDLQCISCDCNLEGTKRPSCNTHTGECVCKRGVAGMFCDECAPGFDSTFPACAECHACSDMWRANVSDVKRAMANMHTLIPDDCHGSDLRTREDQVADMERMLEGVNEEIKGESADMIKDMEDMLQRLRKLTDATDTNRILIDPSAILNSDITNIKEEIQRLLKAADQKHQLLEDAENNDDEEDDPDELLGEIEKRFKSFMSEEQKVTEAKKAVESSMENRIEARRRLSMCGKANEDKNKDLEPLEEKVNELNVTQLNKKVCGSAVECVINGQGTCGGLDCDGAFPLSQKASELEQINKQTIDKIPLKILDTENKLQELKLTSHETKEKAKDLQNKITNNMEDFETEKSQMKKLIQRVRDYLTDDLVPAEDIEKMSRLVLNIKLPKSADDITDMIREIEALISNAERFTDDLKSMEIHTHTATDLMKRALKIKEEAQNTDISEISKNIYEAEKSQSKANDDLEGISEDGDTIRNNLRQISDQLDTIESNLRKPQALSEQIEALKNKMVANKKTAEEAKALADAALSESKDTDLGTLTNLFESLKQKASGQTGSGNAAKRLTEIIRETEDMKKSLTDRQTQMQDLEQRIVGNLKLKQEKSQEVSSLLEEVEALKYNITQRAAEYSVCVG